MDNTTSRARGHAVICCIQIDETVKLLVEKDQ